MSTQYKIFEVMAIALPTKEEIKNGDDKPKIILNPTVIISKDVSTACMQCLSKPELKDKDVEKIEFVVRPFIEAKSTPDFRTSLQGLYNSVQDQTCSDNFNGYWPRGQSVFLQASAEECGTFSAANIAAGKNCCG